MRFSYLVLTLWLASRRQARRVIALFAASCLAACGANAAGESGEAGQARSAHGCAHAAKASTLGLDAELVEMFLAKACEAGRWVDVQGCTSDGRQRVCVSSFVSAWDRAQSENTTATFGDGIRGALLLLNGDYNGFGPSRIYDYVVGGVTIRRRDPAGSVFGRDCKRDGDGRIVDCTFVDANFFDALDPSKLTVEGEPDANFNCHGLVFSRLASIRPLWLQEVYRYWSRQQPVSPDHVLARSDIDAPSSQPVRERFISGFDVKPNDVLAFFADSEEVACGAQGSGLTHTSLIVDEGRGFDILSKLDEGPTVRHRFVDIFELMRKYGTIVRHFRAPAFQK